MPLEDSRGPRRDQRCSDGIFSDGWRLVRKGGRVKAARVWFQHDKLIPYVGGYVHVQMNDYWCQEAIVYQRRYDGSSYIATVEPEKT